MFVFILLLVFFYASHSWLASLGFKQFISKCSLILMIQQIAEAPHINGTLETEQLEMVEIQ